MTDDAPCPRPQRVPPTSDDRAVSTAVTHVLAIGITTILISGLLVASASLLTGQQDSAGRTQLQEIGNRISEQIYAASATVDETATGSSDQTVTVLVDQPSRVSGYSYSVTLADGSTTDCDDPVNEPPDGTPDYCLILDPAAGLNVQTQRVPVNVEGNPADYDITVTTVSGGELLVTVDGNP